MSTVDQFIHKCEKASKDIEKAARDGVNAGAVVMAAAATASAAAATHGSLALRGMPGAKTTAKVLPASSISRPVAVVAGTSAGAWAILQSGAPRHVVGAGKGKTGIGRNKHGVIHATTKAGGKSYSTKLLTFGKGNGAAYGPFVAGGSPARHTFSEAVTAAHPAIVEAVRLESSKAIVKAFR